MSKKIVIIIISVFVLLFGYSIVRYLSSYQTAAITIKPSGVSVVVYGASHHKVTQLTRSGEVRLRPGKYTAAPSGNHVNTTPISFEVKNAGLHLNIDPGYSEAYLASLTTNELPGIHTVIATSYPQITHDFTINPGTLYLYGDWYATTIVQASPGPGANGDVYRLVLRKQNGVWKIVAGPAIVLSASASPSVPRSVLDDINRQSGYSS